MAAQPTSQMPYFRRAELAIAGLAVALLILVSLAVILLRLAGARKDTVFRDRRRRIRVVRGGNPAA